MQRIEDSNLLVAECLLTEDSNAEIILLLLLLFFYNNYLWLNADWWLLLNYIKDYVIRIWATSIVIQLLRRPWLVVDENGLQ